MTDEEGRASDGPGRRRLHGVHAVRFRSVRRRVEGHEEGVEGLQAKQRENFKEVRDIKALLGVNPNGEEARPAVADAPGGKTVASLDDSQRAALVRALAPQPKGTPVWFAVYERDPAARELGRTLQAIFGEAGWVVRGAQAVPFAMKSGVFLFAADEEPPAYVQTAQEALGVAGIRPTVSTGYRAYYGQMRTKPGWQGFEMASDQTYLVVVGPTTPSAGATTGGLDDRQRAALIRALAAQPKGTPVWFAVYQQNPTARELGSALQAAFTEAGWVVRGMKAIPFAMKPGFFLFAADDEPPAYVKTAHEALGLAGIQMTIGTGYRAYYEKMVTKPGWRGFEMTHDQTYVVVIGPAAKPGSSPAAGTEAAASGSSRYLTVILGAVILLTAAGAGARYFHFRPRPTAAAEPRSAAPSP
jgi:hypothetical protein